MEQESASHKLEKIIYYEKIDTFRDNENLFREQITTNEIKVALAQCDAHWEAIKTMRPLSSNPAIKARIIKMQQKMDTWKDGNDAYLQHIQQKAEKKSKGALTSNDDFVLIDDDVLTYKKSVAIMTQLMDPAGISFPNVFKSMRPILERLQDASDPELCLSNEEQKILVIKTSLERISNKKSDDKFVHRAYH